MRARAARHGAERRNRLAGVGGLLVSLIAVVSCSEPAAPRERETAPDTAEGDDDGRESDASRARESDASRSDDASTRANAAVADAAVADSGSTGMPASVPPVSASDAGAPRPQSCSGKPLPARAIGASPPFPVGPMSAGLADYWPTTGFRSEQPDKLGFDPAKLSEAVSFQTPYSRSQAVLIVRHGYIAAEKYFGSFSATTTHESYSMAKSFTSALVGIAIAEGKLASTDEKVCKSYPMQWKCDDVSDRRSLITVAHAMNLMTGLMWTENWHSTATGPNDAYSPNMLDTVLARQATEEPGKTKRYSTGDPALLSGVLQQATGMTVYQYAKQKIFDVIGTPAIRWNQDNKGRTTSYAGLQATATDYAKYGYLYLRRGVWDGKQVIPDAWIERTTQAQDPCNDWNQYLWHVNPPVRLGEQSPSCGSLFCPPVDFADLPPDAFFAEGVNGQFLFVVPSSDLVIVRLANDMPGSEHWDEFALGFLTAVLGAIR